MKNYLSLKIWAVKVRNKKRKSLFPKQINIYPTMLRTGLQAQLFFPKRGKRNQRVTQFFPSRDNIN